MRGYTIATSLVIALLAATLAAAAPQSKRKNNGVAIPLTKRSSSTLLNHDNTVNLTAVDAYAAFVSAKIVRGLDNYEKNMGTTHPSVLERRGLRKRSVNLATASGLSLTKYNNLFWHTTLSIGSPPKQFDVEIDTGSADLFIPTVDGNAITQQHTVWDPSSSKTATDLGLPFSIAFSDGAAVAGKQYTDTVTVAGFTVADTQTIGAATTYSSDMGNPNFPVDGILGLAFQSISRFPASPFFETLVSEKKVMDPVFSFQLSPSGGELFIGGTNEALYQTDTLTYTDVTERGYWQIKMDEIQANGRTIASEVDVVIDTGANFILGDKMKVYRLNKALGGKMMKAGRYGLPCQASPEPSVTLTFGGRAFKIPIEALRLGPISEGSSYCLSAIIANVTPVSFWHVGAPFLQGVYTVFDYGTGTQPTPRVGFAELA